MDAKQIKEYVLKYLKNSNINEISGIKIRDQQSAYSIRIVISNDRYHVEGAIWTNLTYEFNAIDFKMDSVLFDYSASYTILTDLDEHIDKMIKVFQ